MSALIDVLSNALTPEQGLHLAEWSAGCLVLVIAVTLLNQWLVRRQDRRRRAPRFEAPRQLTSTLPFEPVTQELPAVVTGCPGCGRNAGHNAGCPQMLGLRASQIDVPREGKPQ